MKRTIVLFMLCAACGSKDAARDDGTASSQAKSTSAPDKHAASSSPPAKASTATPSTSASSATAPGGGTSVLGGPDWKAVFVGAPSVKLITSLGGGQQTGMTDDQTRRNVSVSQIQGWKGNQAGGGDVSFSPSKKAIAISNYNIKIDPNAKTVDTWIKSALVKDVKHTGGPEVIEVGNTKVAALAGTGTCTLKDGDAADFYWYDTDCIGDGTHEMLIVVVGKTAPEDEKNVALSAIRTVENLERCKPHYKK